MPVRSLIHNEPRRKSNLDFSNREEIGKSFAKKNRMSATRIRREWYQIVRSQINTRFQDVRQLTSIKMIAEPNLRNHRVRFAKPYGIRSLSLNEYADSVQTQNPAKQTHITWTPGGESSKSYRSGARCIRLLTGIVCGWWEQLLSVDDQSPALMDRLSTLTFKFYR